MLNYHRGVRAAVRCTPFATPAAPATPTALTTPAAPATPAALATPAAPAAGGVTLRGFETGAAVRLTVRN